MKRLTNDDEIVQAARDIHNKIISILTPSQKSLVVDYVDIKAAEKRLENKKGE